MLLHEAAKLIISISPEQEIAPDFCLDIHRVQFVEDVSGYRSGQGIHNHCLGRIAGIIDKDFRMIIGNVPDHMGPDRKFLDDILAGGIFIRKLVDRLFIDPHVGWFCINQFSFCWSAHHDDVSLLSGPPVRRKEKKEPEDNASHAGQEHDLVIVLPVFTGEPGNFRGILQIFYGNFLSWFIGIFIFQEKTGIRDLGHILIAVTKFIE
jgi:hypothetical protein